MDVAQAVFSPDGNSILYLLDELPGPASIMRVAVSGGTPEKLLEVAPVMSWLKCSRAPANVCVVSELTGKQLRLTILDPEKGTTGKPIELPAPPSPQSWDLSPDGAAIVSVEAAASPARLLTLDLATRRVREIKSESWNEAQSVAWCADGNGWIITRASGTRGSEILFVDRNGKSKVLWKSDSQRLWNPTVSPDGKRIAFASGMVESNAWMVQGF